MKLTGTNSNHMDEENQAQKANIIEWSNYQGKSETGGIIGPTSTASRQKSQS